METASSASSTDDGTSPTTVETLVANLDEVAGAADTQTAATKATDIRHLLNEAAERGLLDSGVRELTRRDLAEAFVGSIIFATPLLVEDGIFDIAQHFLDTTVAGVPVFLFANSVFVVVMTYALLEWTGTNQAETDMFLRSLPVRVVGILVVSFLVATGLLTLWGRVTWADPVDAIARINVIWTVGALGAALGDILADDPGTPTTADGPLNEFAAKSDAALVEAIGNEFDELEAVVDEVHRDRITSLREEAVAATLDDGFGDRIRKYTSRDIAEAVVGSVFFAIPFLVEDGVFEIAEYFLSFRIGPLPVFFAVNTGFVLGMILALVYWAGPQDVQMSRPLFGIIPRRMVGIAVVSFLTAAGLMTLWGRAEWADPVVALARTSVVWTLASFGASLGDILPGESSGEDINDELAERFDGDSTADRNEHSRSDAYGSE